MQISDRIRLLCQRYRVCSVRVETRMDAGHFRQELAELCREISGKISVEEPVLLLALLDAYEVTRDEDMLQEVLDVVSSNPEKLVPSAENVRLLAYCYYYVEEEECACLAREMLKKLEVDEERNEALREVTEVVRELIGE